MMTFFAAIISLVAAIRCASYGFSAARERNYTAAAATFLLAAASFLCTLLQAY